MPENTYTFERNWSGYSRGVESIVVTAETLEEAKLLVDQGGCCMNERLYVMTLSMKIGSMR